MCNMNEEKKLIQNFYSELLAKRGFVKFRYNCEDNIKVIQKYVIRI